MEMESTIRKMVTIHYILSLVVHCSCVISGMSIDKVKDALGHKYSIPRLKYPFLVSLQYPVYSDGLTSLHEPFCGGTILDRRTILTAAHCFNRTFYFDVEKNHFRIVAGAYDLSVEDKHEQIRLFHKFDITTYMEYDDLSQDNDIAIIHLPEALELNEYVKAINLVDPERGYKTQGAELAGWGKSSNEQTEMYVTSLNEARVNIHSRKMCTGQWGDDFHPESMICASGAPGPDGLSPDACQGDSGGPLVAQDLEEPQVKYVVGIISYGFGCGFVEYPGVFTRVDKYLLWIHEMRMSRRKRKRWNRWTKNCESDLSL